MGSQYFMSRGQLLQEIKGLFLRKMIYEENNEGLTKMLVMDFLSVKREENLSDDLQFFITSISKDNWKLLVRTRQHKNCNTKVVRNSITVIKNTNWTTSIF